MFRAELLINCNNHIRIHQDPSEMMDLGQTSLHNWKDAKICLGLDSVIKHKPQSSTFIPNLPNSQSFSRIPHIKLPEISGLSLSELGTVCVFLSKLWEIKLFFMVLARYQPQHCISVCASFQHFSLIWTSKHHREDKVLPPIIGYKSAGTTLILLVLFQHCTILNEKFHVHFKAERGKKNPNNSTMNDCKAWSWTFLSFPGIKLSSPLPYKSLPAGSTHSHD